MSSRDWTTEDVRRRAPSVVLVEALGPSFFAHGHLPGAVNIPPHRVRETVRAVLADPRATIVVYGASPTCGQAGMVIRILRDLGYQDVSRYPAGKQGWAAAGLPLVTSEG
jgi:rhodanese-related sulfurtransferase